MYLDIHFMWWYGRTLLSRFYLIKSLFIINFFITFHPFMKRDDFKTFNLDIVYLVDVREDPSCFT